MSESGFGMVLLRQICIAKPLSEICGFMAACAAAENAVSYCAAFSICGCSGEEGALKMALKV